MDNEQTGALREVAQRWGITLSDHQCAQYRTFLELLYRTNETLNLTRIPRAQAVSLQLLDSLSVHLATPCTAHRHLIDIGTGAGFPGVPLAIAFPQLRCVLVDATAKRLRFIERVARELQLENVTVLHGRAEQLAHQPEHREQYDLVTARAVAPLAQLLTWLSPFCAVGGKVAALKGPQVTQEQEALGEVSALGLASGQLVPVPLPSRTNSHVVARFEKVAPCAPELPKRGARPSRKD